MPHRTPHTRIPALVALALLSAACAADVATPGPAPLAPLLASASGDAGSGGFTFTPLPTSAACGPSTEKSFVLPPGYDQLVIAREGDGGTLDLWDMNTLNEDGAQAGRFLYRTHEIGANGQVSVTDLETGVTRIVAQRADWERFDGIVWTPWGTILAAEEAINSTLKDPTLPAARGGHVYEIDPETGASVLRAAIGSRSHEGTRRRTSRRRTMSHSTRQATCTSPRIRQRRPARTSGSRSLPTASTNRPRVSCASRAFPTALPSRRASTSTSAVGGCS
jgi:hypothetical protein